jgi:hypothetical protein
MPRLLMAHRRALSLSSPTVARASLLPRAAFAAPRPACAAAARWNRPPAAAAAAAAGVRGIVCGRPARKQGEAVVEGEAAAAGAQSEESAGAEEAAVQPVASAVPDAADADADADADDVTSCRAWVQNVRTYDPGDYHGFVPGQEKVTFRIDLSPLKLSTLEVGVLRGIVGDRFNPATKQLRLTEESYISTDENLEAAYASARMLLDEARRLAAEMAADPDLPRELVMKKLGGEAWCERTSKWIGESPDAPPSAPVPGALSLHVGNLPRGMTGEDLQKKLTGLVGGPVAVSKKRRHVWARVTVRDNEEARAAVEQAVADVESKYPVRVSTWAH